MMNLTNGERNILVNALYTAAAKYSECAKDIRASDMHDVGKRRLIAEFQKQAAEATALAEKLEA